MTPRTPEQAFQALDEVSRVYQDKDGQCEECELYPSVADPSAGHYAGEGFSCSIAILRDFIDAARTPRRMTVARKKREPPKPCHEAIAWGAWRLSKEGRECRTGEPCLENSLENRIWTAYMAGYDAAREHLAAARTPGQGGGDGV